MLRIRSYFLTLIRNMANSDVHPVPSAPLYPVLEPQKQAATSFRLPKICDIQKVFENEIKHFGRVAKKYKRAQAVFQNTAVATGTSSVILSGSTLVTSLTGFGIIIGAPLAGVSALLGATSAGCAAARKRFTRKMVKHKNTVTLAQSKLNSIDQLVLKALVDEEISDEELTLILREIDKYHGMKASLQQRNSTAMPSRQHEAERDRLKRELSKKNLGVWPN